MRDTVRAQPGQLASRLPGPVRKLLRPAYNAYLSVRSPSDYRYERTVVTDATGLPLPPPSLRRKVTAWDGSEAWLESGKVDAALIRRLVEDHGRPLDEMEAILDFGCGCGRIARWWRDLDGPQVCGCDYDPKLVDWCRENLPSLDVHLNSEDPPLPFREDRFDLIYAISLFTHLTAERQREWLNEVRRLLKPDGLFLFTVVGSRFDDLMDGDERRRFRRGELVVRHPELSGSGCAVFHPPEYVRDELLPSTGYEIVEWVDEDRSGQSWSVSPLPCQDNYLVRAT